MDKIRIVHDAEGGTLTVWFADPRLESVAEESSDEVVIMKDKENRVIGFELLHFKASDIQVPVAVESHRRAAV